MRGGASPGVQAWYGCHVDSSRWGDRAEGGISGGATMEARRRESRCKRRLRIGKIKGKQGRTKERQRKTDGKRGTREERKEHGRNAKYGGNGKGYGGAPLYAQT